ncbi:hypothetical protein D3C81_1769290 [compost metagenome]
MSGAAETVGKARRASFAETVNVSKLSDIEGHPIQQAVQATCCKKFFPGAGADMGQGQTVLAAEPGQARKKLAFASRARLPTAQRVKVLGFRHVQFGAFCTA